MRAAKWIGHLTAKRNIDGSIRTLRSLLGCSLTFHRAANGYLVVTKGKVQAERKGTGHPTLLCRRLRISVLSNRHFLTYGDVYGTNVTFTKSYSEPVWIKYDFSVA